MQRTESGLADGAKRMAERLAAAADASQDRRRHVRVRPTVSFCNLGAVLDLSQSGARMHSRRQMDGEIEFVVNVGDVAFSTRARVVWTRRTGLLRHQIGLEFVGVEDHDVELLQQIVRAATNGRGVA
ncbi:MAG: PilZ domain-containing protein [Planctomycetota bacterium]